MPVVNVWQPHELYYWNLAGNGSITTRRTVSDRKDWFGGAYCCLCLRELCKSNHACTLGPRAVKYGPLRSPRVQVVQPRQRISWTTQPNTWSSTSGKQTTQVRLWTHLIFRVNRIPVCLSIRRINFCANSYGITQTSTNPRRQSRCVDLGAKHTIPITYILTVTTWHGMVNPVAFFVSV